MIVVMTTIPKPEVSLKQSKMAEREPMATAMRLRNQLQSVYGLDPLRNEEEVKVKIKDLNEHIVCILCAGYFIDATTITECLHTFCKSCIVKYLQTSKYCPMCNIKIHETQPLLNLKLDRVMQDIVYKLVPGLQESEDKRIKEFYQSRGLERITQLSNEGAVADAAGLLFTHFDRPKAHFYRNDEQVSLCLESSSLLPGKDRIKLVQQGRKNPLMMDGGVTWPVSRFSRGLCGAPSGQRCSTCAKCCVTA
ncbi:polycomb group RING finger protein 1-like isoform X5 [Brienomyrus brachyistius]|uniref:polycomb group RING finger protein 1-like isoform X5 n=1 Tax=Brienomyrus brachyistius TaxID=42636 RepID=UPI0020B265B2|nr:polycomb group RING finger protein 1-like isoform X5 [Brienomyrus brachyistius]